MYCRCGGMTQVSERSSAADLDGQSPLGLDDGFEFEAERIKPQKVAKYGGWYRGQSSGSSSTVSGR